MALGRAGIAVGAGADRGLTMVQRGVAKCTQSSEPPVPIPFLAISAGLCGALPSPA